MFPKLADKIDVRRFGELDDAALSGVKSAAPVKKFPRKFPGPASIYAS
jgi:hypothetical protein